jgi:hypothetical protein
VKTRERIKRLRTATSIEELLLIAGDKLPGTKNDMDMAHEWAKEFRSTRKIIEVLWPDMSPEKHSREHLELMALTFEYAAAWLRINHTTLKRKIMGTQKEEILVRCGFDNSSLASGLRSAQGSVMEWAKISGRPLPGRLRSTSFSRLKKAWWISRPAFR